MEALFNTSVLVVKREEVLDADDRVSIGYEIMFVSSDPDSATTSFALSTDDKKVYDKFKVGMVTTLEFLEHIPDMKLPNTRSN